jgi:hypothetical protein
MIPTKENHGSLSSVTIIENDHTIDGLFKSTVTLRLLDPQNYAGLVSRYI